MSGDKRFYLYLGSLIFLLPFIRIRIFLDPFTIGRFVWWSLISLSALWLLFPKFKKIQFHWLDFFVGSFYLVNLISVLWAKNFGEAMYTTQTYFLFLFTYFTIKQIFLNNPLEYRSAQRIILFITIFCCGYLSFELIRLYQRSGLSGDMIYLITGLSGHKNLASSFIFLLLCLVLYFSTSSRQSRWLILLSLPIIVFILILRSRAVYLALFILVTTMVVAYALRGFSIKRKVLLWSSISILAIGAAGTFFAAKTELGNQYLDYLNPSKYVQSATGVERIFVWYKTMDLIRERPVFGYGVGNWKLWFPSNNVAGGFRLQEQDIVFTRAHNDFLEIWAEVGTVGLICYLAIFIMAILTCLHQFSQSTGRDRIQRIILLASIFGYVCIAFFGFPKERPEHQILLALIFALIVKLNPEFKKLNITLSRSGRKWILAVVTAFMLLSIPIGFYRTKAEVASRQILLATSTKNSTLVGELARSAISIWSNVNIMVIPYKWYEGLSHYWEEEYEMAENAFAEAYAINPFNFNVLNNYGSTLVQLGKYQESIDRFERALQINPKFEEALFNISYAHHQLGNDQEALRWLDQVEKDIERRDLFIETIQNKGTIKLSN